MHGVPYTYEECYNEAKKYSLYIDFLMKSPSHWQRANKQGWIKDYTWLQRREVKAVAQYTMDGEFIRTFRTCGKAGKAVSSAKKAGECIRNCCNGKTSFSYKFKWLYVEDMDRAEELFKEREKPICRDPYTVDEIMAEASKYKTMKEFREKAYRYMDAAWRRGIVDQLPFERDVNPYIDKLFNVYAYEFPDRSVYVGLTWRKRERHNEHKSDGSSPVKKHSIETGFEIPEPIYLLENLGCDEALKQEDAYRRKYKEDGWNVLNKAKTGLKSGSLGATHGKYSLKQLRECVRECVAKGRNLTWFIKNRNGLYCFASSNGYMHELDLLDSDRARRDTYTEEYCFFAALQYDTIKDFFENDYSVYQTSIYRGWRDTYFWLKRERRRGSVLLDKPFTRFEDFEVFGFSSVKETAKFLGFKCGNKKYVEVERKAQEKGYEVVLIPD